MGAVEFYPVVFEEVVYVVLGVHGFGGEDCAFVGIAAENGGDFDEFPGCKVVVHVILSKPAWSFDHV